MVDEILHRTLKIEGYKTMVGEILHRTLKIEGYKTMGRNTTPNTKD